MGLLTHRFRYIVVFGCFLCLTAINSNYITMNFTFICMKDDMTGAIKNDNGTFVSRYDYTPMEKSYIVWAVAAGTILGTFPINWGYIHYGARFPFLIAGTLSALSTALVPFAASFSYPFLLGLRFVQGLAYSADFAAIGLVTVRWAPLAETGVFIAAMTSFTPVSTTITNPVSGWICDSSLGWKWAFYAHAIATVIFFLGWLWYYTDNPSTHPRVDSKELKKIQEGKTEAHIKGDSFVPYLEICKNKTILVVWFNSFGEMTTVTLLLTYMPLYLNTEIIKNPVIIVVWLNSLAEMFSGISILTYMPIYFHTVLGFDVVTTGILAAVSSFMHAPLKYASGYFSDRIHSINEIKKMQVCNFIAVGFAGIFCILIGIVKRAAGGVLAVVFFTGVYLSMSANCGGFYKCGTLVSRQYAHFVLATIQFMKCVALVAAPASWAIFVRDETDVVQWSYVFYLNGAVLIVANILFLFVCTDQPAAFTHITRETRDQMKKDT
ncbi:unnamed protein product, partial [Mesorhabditis belari]|uniref:Major facilitator superfamily (MFS) profile domain-containing protein n=1 Tax=Mesorhabditis belari TaxID=2138241 RepID=A0AAF3F9T0_9BILA